MLGGLGPPGGCAADRGSGALSFGATHEEFREHRHRPRRRAFFLSAAPRRAGYIEMRPFELPRKAREEARGRHASCRSASDVCEIREITLELVLIIVPERHAPGAVVSGIGCRKQ